MRLCIMTRLPLYLVQELNINTVDVFILMKQKFERVGDHVLLFTLSWKWTLLDKYTLDYRYLVKITFGISMNSPNI